MSGVDWWPRRWADIQPDRPAVTCDGVTLSWAELDRRIGAAAAAFAGLGVSRGDRVGCLMHNCVEFVIALHAASRLGAIFVPINVRYTAGELRRALDHVGVRLLRPTTASSTSSPPAEPASRSCGGARGRLRGPFRRHPMRAPGGTTTGTCSSPRQHRHAAGGPALAGRVHVDGDGHCAHPPLQPRRRYGVAAAGLFTGGLNVATALAQCGGHLVMMSAFDAGEALALIGAHRGTLFHGVPLMCQRMADHPDWESADLSSLRLGRTGAAPVSSGLMQSWLRRGIR